MSPPQFLSMLEGLKTVLGEYLSFCMRLTLGFGHFGAPNLALVVCLWPKHNGSARSPGLRQPRGPGRRNRHESVQLEHNDRYILGIHQVYTGQWALLVNTFFYLYRFLLGIIFKSLGISMISLVIHYYNHYAD